MSLAKIPAVVSVLWAFRKTITPPNPPPTRDDKPIQTNFMEMGWFTTRSSFYANGLLYLAGIAEIATILAWNYPSVPLSQIVLSWLVWNKGNPEALRLSPATLAGLVMVVTGTLLRLLTYRHMGKFFRFQASIQKDHQLITTGPYSIVRHPSYTGLLLTHPGWFLWQLGQGSWVRESGFLNTEIGKVVFIAFSVLKIMAALYLTLGRMTREDEALRAHFGKEWDDWADRVRYQVILGVW